MHNPLATTLLGIPMRNPVIAASGTFGFGTEYGEFTDVSRDLHSCRFRLKWYGENTGTSLALYKGKTLIRELSVNDTVVDALETGVQYRLVLTYAFGENQKSIEMDLPIRGYHPVKNGEILKRHSPDVAVFDKTMGDFRVHFGYDIAATNDPKVYAMMGQVVEIGEGTVAIRTANGDTFYYMSLDSVASGLSVGASVSFDQVIGTVGQSWMMEIAEGQHLHLEIKDANGNYVDPAIFLE